LKPLHKSGSVPRLALIAMLIPTDFYLPMLHLLEFF
jgi:hypothetical protein